MSRITHVTYREDQTCAVEVDGEDFVTLDALLFLELKLSEGDEVEQKTLDRLRQLARRYDAEQKAFLLLGLREYGSGELRDKLVKKYEFLPEIASAAVEKAVRLGYVDDARYAAMLGRELFLRKGFSLSRARFEMSSRFLPDELVEEQLSLYADTEADRAEAVVRKKYLGKLSEPKGRNSVLGALLRLGFSMSAAKQAMNSAAEVSPSEPDADFE